jgi:hypothetical protein
LCVNINRWCFDVEEADHFLKTCPLQFRVNRIIQFLLLKLSLYLHRYGPVRGWPYKRSQSHHGANGGNTYNLRSHILCMDGRLMGDNECLSRSIGQYFDCGLEHFFLIKAFNFLSGFPDSVYLWMKTPIISATNLSLLFSWSNSLIASTL